MMRKNILTILATALVNVLISQNIELSFWKLDEKQEFISSPPISTYKDQALGLRLFDLEKTKGYQQISVIVEINGFHVDEYTFPIGYTADMPELYDHAELSSKAKPGTRYKDLILVDLKTEENPNRNGQFLITATRNYCNENYIFSKEGNNEQKEYKLTAKVTGQNYHKEYDVKSDMYYNVPSHDPVLLSNVASTTIVTTDTLEKLLLDLTIGRKSDLFDAINQGNDKINELNGDDKPKKKK